MPFHSAKTPPVSVGAFSCSQQRYALYGTADEGRQSPGHRCPIKVNRSGARLPADHAVLFPMSLLNSLARQLTQSAEVVAVQHLGAHAYRLTLQGPALVGWAYTPGQTLNVFFGLAPALAESSLRERTYSIWGYDPVAGRLNLAVCTFSAGAGAHWAARCRIGDRVYFYGPGGKFLLDPTAPAYALLGDVSCLAHLYELRRHLPTGAPVVSVVHARHAADYFPDLDGTFPLQVVVADDFSATQYLSAAQEQGLQSVPPALIYWGGPQATCVAGHRLLQHEWRWPSHLLKTKPFWK